MNRHDKSFLLRSKLHFEFSYFSNWNIIISMYWYEFSRSSLHWNSYEVFVLLFCAKDEMVLNCFISVLNSIFYNWELFIKLPWIKQTKCKVNTYCCTPNACDTVTSCTTLHRMPIDSRLSIPATPTRCSFERCRVFNVDFEFEICFMNWAVLKYIFENLE